MRRTQAAERRAKPLRNMAKAAEQEAEDESRPGRLKARATGAAYRLCESPRSGPPAWRDKRKSNTISQGADWRESYFCQLSQVIDNNGHQIVFLRGAQAAERGTNYRTLPKLPCGGSLLRAGSLTEAGFLSGKGAKFYHVHIDFIYAVQFIHTIHL